MRKPAYSIILLVFAFGLVVTHHLVGLILISLILLLSISGIVFSNISGENMKLDLTGGVIIVTSLLGYWALVGTSFIRAISTFLYYMWYETIIGGTISSGSSDSVSEIYYYGIGEQSNVILSGSEFLTSSKGIYFSILVTFTVFAVIYVASTMETKSKNLFILGAFAIPLSFPTPLSSLRGVNRLGFYFECFYTSIIAMSIIYWKDKLRFRMICVVLLGFLIVLAPVIGLGITPLNDTITSHEPQRSFDSAEETKLTEASKFAQWSDSPISTMWITMEFFDYLNKDARQPLQVTNKSINVSEGLFVYRESWASLNARKYEPTGGSIVRFSRRCIKQIYENKNRVYDAGRVGIIWENSEYRLKNCPRTVRGVT
jgi:hypothetical protein